MAGYTDELLETLDTKARGKPFNASKYFNYYSFDIMGVSRVVGFRAGVR